MPQPATKRLLTEAVAASQAADPTSPLGGALAANYEPKGAAAGAAVGKADKATTITAGTGLAGGGDLSAGRTLSVTYGTSAGTAAQGNDSRIAGAAQKASNLADLASAPIARSNLGLGDVATRAASDFLLATARGAASGVATLDSGAKVPVAQIPDLSGAYLKNALRHAEYTASASAATGTEAAAGTMALDATRSPNAADFVVNGSGQLKILAAGLYSFHLHAGYNANNFGNGATNQWVIITNDTLPRVLARNVAAGGFELSVSVPSIYCQANDLIGFKIQQFTGATKTIDSRIFASRIY